MSNREIKFRVWDKRNNEFVVNEEEEYTSFEDRSKCFDLWDWASTMGTCLSYPMDDYIFQQYIGLKDKNGKEIYEGDILKCKGFDGWFDKEGYYYNEEVKHKIICPGESETCGFLFISVDREIIGNIFENLDLLKNVE